MAVPWVGAASSVEPESGGSREIGHWCGKMIPVLKNQLRWVHSRMPQVASIRRFSKAVHAVAGLMLVSAAIAKFSGRDEPVIGQVVQGRTLDALICYELTLGALLLSGRAPRLASRMALITFAAFAAFSVRAAVGGSGGCSCFGLWWHVAPAFMAAVDTCVVVLFLSEIHLAQGC